MIKIEIGVLMKNGSTHWPAAFRTYADEDDVRRAMSHVIALAKDEQISGVRTTKVD